MTIRAASSRFEKWRAFATAARTNRRMARAIIIGAVCLRSSAKFGGSVRISDATGSKVWVLWPKFLLRVGIFEVIFNKKKFCPYRYVQDINMQP